MMSTRFPVVFILDKELCETFESTRTIALGKVIAPLFKAEMLSWSFE
jgi:hypothetical protein